MDAQVSSRLFTLDDLVVNADWEMVVRTQCEINSDRLRFVDLNFPFPSPLCDFIYSALQRLNSYIVLLVD